MTRSLRRRPVARGGFVMAAVVEISKNYSEGEGLFFPRF